MQEPGNQHGGAGSSVLIADTDTSTVTALSKVFTQADYKVSLAYSGEETQERLKARPFDVLVLDARIPRRSGFDLPRYAVQQNPSLAVLLTVAAHDLSSLDPYWDADAYGRIIKPFEVNTVAVQVARSLQRQITVKMDRERRLAAQTTRFNTMYRHFLDVLILILSAKDEDTYSRSGRVAELASALANRLRPEDKEFCSYVRLAALFHDIGIVGIPDAVLHKAGKLTADEKAVVDRHPEMGENILSPVFGNNAIVSMVRGHHEHWDGNGYPDGLAGDQIPLGARVVAVADAFVAMTSERPYRAAMPKEEALRILKESTAKQWDPEIVQGFLGLEEVGGLSSIPEQDTFEVARKVVADVPPAKPRPQASSPDADSRPVAYVEGDLTPAMGRVRSNVAKWIDRGGIRFLLDLRQVGEVDKAGVEALYALHLRARGSGGQMTLRNVPDRAMSAFRASGLADDFVFESSASCLSAPTLIPRRASALDRSYGWRGEDGKR